MSLKSLFRLNAKALMRFNAKALITGATMLAVSCSLAASANAQKHELIRGNMAPGLAAQYRLMGNQALGEHVQPVRIAAPDGTILSIVANGGFTNTGSSAQTVGMRVGPLYRFRVTGFGTNFENELYPSIELLDRLHPPEGLENQFPIIVSISNNDLKQAVAGNLVTKVIYLEDAETALPRVQKESEQPYFDVSSAEDPLRTAEGLGRPMAILRIGSRVPTADELAYSHETAFNSEAPMNVPQVFPFVENDGFEIELPGVVIPGDSSSNEKVHQFNQPLQPLKPPKMSVTTWQNMSDADKD